VLLRRRQVAAWRRWHAKLPHNRVRREVILDDLGRKIGYGQSQPTPEPTLPTIACRLVKRPSGRVEVELDGPSGESLRRLQETYRQSRRPVPLREQVPVLSATMEEMRVWRNAIERT